MDGAVYYVFTVYSNNKKPAKGVKVGLVAQNVTLVMLRYFGYPPPHNGGGIGISQTFLQCVY